MLMQHVVNLDSLKWWLTFAVTLIGFAGAVSAPILRLLRKYKNILKEAQVAMEEQCRTNADQAEQIEESKQDRIELRNNINGLQSALLAQIKIELDKICDRALRRNFVTVRELDHANMLFGAYEELEGNHGMKGKIEALRRLRVRDWRDDDKFVRK